MSWKNVNSPVSALALSVAVGALVVLAAVPASAQYTFGAVDADGKNVAINRSGQTTLVLIGNDDHEDALREAARVVDDVRGVPSFRLYVVVDLRDSIGSMAPNIVKSQMKESMDEEVPQLRQLYAKHGNRNNPRADMATFADFDGQIVNMLGWKSETEDHMRAVLFDKSGKAVARWDKLRKGDYPQLERQVRQRLQSGSSGQSAKPAKPVKAAKAVPVEP